MSVAVAKDPVRIPKAIEAKGEPKYPYPGIPTTCDGAEAVVHVEIHVA